MARKPVHDEPRRRGVVTHQPEPTLWPPDPASAADPTAPLDEAQREALLVSLLRLNPGALVRAMDVDGRLVAVPSSIELMGQQADQALNILEVFASHSRFAVVAAFVEAKEKGIARARVDLINGSSGWSHLIDLRQRHGVLIAVLTTDSYEDLAVSLAVRPSVPPRTGQMEKDEVAIIRSVDEAICRILGYGSDELVGIRALALIHPEDHERSMNAWMEMLANPGGTTRIRTRQRRKDGSWLWMELTNTNLLNDPEPRVLTEMVDVSDEMAAVEALRQREQFLLRLADALPSGILHVDLDRNMVYANARLRQVLGVLPTGPVSGQFATVAPADRLPLRAVLDRALDQGEDGDIEVGVRLPDEVSARRCTIAVRALTDSHGAPNGAVVCVDDVTEASALRAALHRRATVDDLTGCLNRGALLEALESRLAGDRRSSGGTAVIYMDLDGFKAVNDTFGHRVGDLLLVSAAERMRLAVRAGDVVGRMGGDEFVVVASDVASLDEAAELAQRIGASLAEPLEIVGGLPIRIRSSFGVAWTSETAVTADMLTVAADRAMYESKRAGAALPVTVSV